MLTATEGIVSGVDVIEAEPADSESGSKGGKRKKLRKLGGDFIKKVKGILKDRKDSDDLNRSGLRRALTFRAARRGRPE